MYIPPGFTFIICEPVGEEAFRAWAVGNGGVWHVAGRNHFGSYSARVTWAFGPYRDMTAKLRMLSEEDKDEWIPRELMHMPPQSLIKVEMSEAMDEDPAQYVAVLQSLFDCWNSYIYDIRAHEWVSSLLSKLLPSLRLLQHEPLPPSPPTPWIWVNSKYIKNEAYPNGDTGTGSADTSLGQGQALPLPRLY